MSDLFASQTPLCPKCKLALDKRHTIDECRAQAEFRRKARASFEALEWGTGAVARRDGLEPPTSQPCD